MLKMFFRLKVLPISFYSCQKATIIQNVKTNLTLFKTVNSNIFLPYRSYSEDPEQTKLKEMVVDYGLVQKAVLNEKTLIVDVRELEEIKEHGKIPNSVNIPLMNIPNALNLMSDSEFEKTYGRKKPTENTEIIFYCMIGKRSGMAQQNAISYGYKNVKNYVGSWTDWASRSQ